MSSQTALFVGGCRSGKSDLALRWTAGFAAKRIFIATAAMADAHEYKDQEMIARIQRHQAGRDQSWQTIEEPLALVAALHGCAHSSLPVLVDCISLWLGNMLAKDFSDQAVLAEVAALGSWLAISPMPVAMVSNEVGLGLVPDNALGRRYRDLAGEANQILATHANTVIFASCGLPLVLKGHMPASIF